MAYVVMRCTVMAHIVVADIFMSEIVMSEILMARGDAATCVLCARVSGLADTVDASMCRCPPQKCVQACVGTCV